ncbi:hypothetical protein SUDANB2_03506 [Streptomyces sp. enrichment culture]
MGPGGTGRRPMVPAGREGVRDEGRAGEGARHEGARDEGRAGEGAQHEGAREGAQHEGARHEGVQYASASPPSHRRDQLSPHPSTSHTPATTLTPTQPKWLYAVPARADAPAPPAKEATT